MPYKIINFKKYSFNFLCWLTLMDVVASTKNGTVSFHRSQEYYNLRKFNFFFKLLFQLKLAALDEPYSGDMHGVQNADYTCYRQAKRANIKGTFRAFLASRTQNIDSIVRYQDRDLPVVNMKVVNQ